MKSFFTRTAILLVIYLITAYNFRASAQTLAFLQISDLTAQSRNGNVGLTWKTQSETDLRQFEIEFSTDGITYKNLGFIPAHNNSNGDIYEFENSVSYVDSAFYRIKVIDKNGQWMYTNPVLFHINKISAFFVYPSVITTSELNIYLKDPFNSLEVVSMSGAIMIKQNLDGRMGRLDIPLSSAFAPGVYVVQLNNHSKTISQKIIVQ